MNDRALEEGADPEAFYDALYDRLDFPVISNPRSMILDARWFYDSNFHMNEAGMTKYTLLLLADIKNLLGLSQKSAVPVPDPPDLAETVRADFSGDSSQADCYTYEPLEDGLQITGLNEKGSSLTALLIPAACDGKPVHRFSADAFTGRETIVSVTVQENITVILDGSFQGCTSMERLILTQRDPAAIRVGYGLTEGASFRILVPADAFSAYANNYFWGFYHDGRLVSYEE